MEDDGGTDEKIIAVPAPKIHPFNDSVLNYTDIPQVNRDQIEHFFAHYKDLEKGKWIKDSRLGGCGQSPHPVDP
jgi:inorganic pyrophosphatase